MRKLVWASWFGETKNRFQLPLTLSSEKTYLVSVGKENNMDKRAQLATSENLRRVDRKTAPTTDSDWDYFITQLIEVGKLSLFDGVKLYVR